MVAKLDTIYLPQYYDIIYRQYFALYLNISSGSVVWLWAHLQVAPVWAV